MLDGVPTPHEPTATTGTASATGSSTPHRWAIFAIVTTALFMSSVDLTIVSTALPTLGTDLHSPGLNWTSWIITTYALGRVVITPLAGRVSEILGVRRIFLVALGVFTVSSLACGLAPNLLMLIVLRGVQGIGGAAFMPSATGLVAAGFGTNRDRAVGSFSSIFPIGAIIGPVLGGIVVASWSWRGVFLINVPIGIGILFAGHRLLPHAQAKTGTRFDLVGSILLCAALLAAALSVSYIGSAQHGPADPAFVAGVTVTLVAGAMLLRRADLPGAVLPRRLLLGNGFGIMNLINVLYGGAALGLASLVPLYGQDRYGMDSLTAGTLLTARAIGTVTVAGVATFALRRTGYRLPMVVGYALSAIGLAMLALAPRYGASPQLWVSISALVVGLGMGTALPASNNASMQIDPKQAASIAGLRVTLRQLGSIAAVATTTALMSRSATPGLTEASVFVAFALIMAAVVPLTRLVPDHRDRW